MCSSLDREHKWQNFYPFGPFFDLLPRQPRKSKFWKNEKKPGGIIILHIRSVP